MDLIIDASSIINLENAGVLEVVCSLTDRTICISPLVLGECQPTCAARLAQLESEAQLHFVDPEEISAETFLELLEQHDLGEGETECMALSLGSPYVFCCDDRRAREASIALLGEGRVVGSLRLLKWCVAEQLMNAEKAFACYEKMKAEGGFLPEVPLEWFGDQS